VVLRTVLYTRALCAIRYHLLLLGTFLKVVLRTRLKQERFALFFGSFHVKANRHIVVASQLHITSPYALLAWNPGARRALLRSHSLTPLRPTHGSPMLAMVSHTGDRYVQYESLGLCLDFSCTPGPPAVGRFCLSKVYNSELY
jgi:hypothetical protein